MTDLAMMPAHELVKLYKAREASPVEATKAALKRAEVMDDASAIVWMAN